MIPANKKKTSQVLFQTKQQYIMGICVIQPKTSLSGQSLLYLDESAGATTQMMFWDIRDLHGTKYTSFHLPFS
jgi:hypothetical protein